MGNERPYTDEGEWLQISHSECLGKGFLAAQCLRKGCQLRCRHDNVIQIHEMASQQTRVPAGCRGLG